MTIEDARLHQRGGELHNIGRRERWALVLFVIYYQGVRFVLDYRMGTCPLLSELGQRRAPILPVLSEPVRDAGVAARIRAVSRRALIQAAVVALGLTILSTASILVAAA